MPGFDRRGPLGQGPRTGRGMGNCQTTVETQTTETGFFRENRLGMGRGGFNRMGRGRGNCRFFNRGMGQRSIESTDDLSWIKSKIRSMAMMLENLEQRLPGKTN
ncbi:DUF5320 domain-containing protein [bacterium]|nr:DUF5320 domain-containing protein [bacterium]